jgi:hypothetical protein
VIKRYIVVILFLFSTSGLLFGQSASGELIQFSGVVLTADSIHPVPFTNISIKNTKYGTVADYYGYFSLVARKADTILFTAIGFKQGVFVIPDTATESRYSLIQVMPSDTIMLPQTVIYPWPSKEQFKEAFLYYKVPEDDIERAKRNLRAELIHSLADAYAMDGSQNYKFAMQQMQDKYYYNGQLQPISILNPFAWAQFIKAWKEGKFKRKKKVKY